MLEGTRIVDLSHLLPGQYASALLAQLGADVVMVESPDGGHRTRQFPASFAMYNHSKESVVLDLGTDRGTAAFRSLVEGADVVIEQFRPGVVERLGVDYEAVSAVSPDVVYCSISGYGQVGPEAETVGHDLNFAARAGILDQTGRTDGPPVIPGVPMVDIGTSVFAALSICAALVGGEGEYVDLAMADVAVNEASNNLAEFFGRGAAPERGEALLTGGYPCYALYECEDERYLSVAAVEPQFWTELCDEVGLPEYADEQFARGDRRDEMFDAFTARFRERTRAEWLDVLDQTNLPVAPVAELDQVPEDEHVRSRDVIRSIDGADGQNRVVAFPARFADHDVSVRAPPLLGEHTRPTLAAVGYDADEIDRLASDGVVETGPGESPDDR